MIFLKLLTLGVTAALVLVLFAYVKESKFTWKRGLKIFLFLLFMTPVLTILYGGYFLLYTPRDLVDLKNKGLLYNNFYNNTSLIPESGTLEADVIDKLGMLNSSYHGGTNGKIQCYLIFRIKDSDWHYRVKFVKPHHRKNVVVVLIRAKGTAYVVGEAYYADELLAYIRERTDKYC